jgi:hypothetical protein
LMSRASSQINVVMGQWCVCLQLSMSRGLGLLVMYERHRRGLRRGCEDWLVTVRGGHGMWLEEASVMREARGP